MLKTGKLEFVKDYRNRLYSTYRNAALMPGYTVPFGMDLLQKYQNLIYGMLRNGPDDSVKKGFQSAGCCVWSGAGHETIFWTNEAGHPIKFTGTNIISDYSACTGYNINDPNTDQGTDVRTALLYRQKTGIVDSTGKRHKIGGFVLLDTTKLDTNGYPYEVLESLLIFNNVGIGFNFPDSAMTQFNNNQPWTVVKGSPVDGGHYVWNIVAFDGTGRLEKVSVCPIGTLICTHGERNRSVNPTWLVNAQDNR